MTTLIEKVHQGKAECLRPFLSAFFADPARLTDEMIEDVYDYLFAATDAYFKARDKELEQALAYLRDIVALEGITTAADLARYFKQLDRQMAESMAGLEKARTRVAARPALAAQVVKVFRGLKDRLRPIRPWGGGINLA